MGWKLAKRVGLPLLAVLIALIALAAGGDKDAAVEKEISLEKAPAPVRATILAEAGEHEVLEVEKVSVGKEVYFEAEWVDDGQEVEIRVAPDGKLLGKEREPLDDEESEGEDGEDEEGGAEKS